MENAHPPEIELYPLETFKTLLDHEVNRSHRYGDSLTLIDLIVQADPPHPEHQHSAELLAIHALYAHLRKVDIPCKKDNEFLILMPATSAPGARTACERLRKFITTTPPADNKAPLKPYVFIGMATLRNEDRSVSGEGLIHNAAASLQHAQTNRLASVVSFSDLAQ